MVPPVGLDKKARDSLQPAAKSEMVLPRRGIREGWNVARVIESETRYSRASSQNYLHVAEVDAGRACPPYQIRGAEKFYFTVAIDPERVQPFLPAGLRVAPGNTGVLSTFTVADSPRGQWSSAVLGVAVGGHDSPDGMEGVYWTGSFADDAGLSLMREYDGRVMPGSARISRSGDVVTSKVLDPMGETLVEVSMRLATAPELLFDGAYNYLGSDGADGANVFSIIGHDRRVRQGQLESMNISPHAPAGVRALEPSSLGWGVYHEHIDYIMGVPRAVDVDRGVLEDDAKVGLLLAIFDNQKRAAVILDRSGTVQFRNETADEMFGRHLGQDSSLAALIDDSQTNLADVVRLVSTGSSIAEWVPLGSVGELGQMVAQITSLDPMVAGHGGVLMQFSQPGSPRSAEVATILRLLGLTPAEAKLASLVGGGSSPREAAENLGITENTARSTLRQVFDKLRIGRQSELARIVSRLEAL